VYDLEDVSSQSGAKWKYQGGTGYKGSGYGFGVALSKDIVSVAGQAMKHNFVQLGPYCCQYESRSRRFSIDFSLPLHTS